MKQHVYKFEFNYSRMVNGKKTKFVIPIVVHDVGYVDACCRVDEHVKKNFGDRVSEDSLIKYVGEFIDGEFKPFVEMKEEECMLIGKSKKELVNLNKGLMIDVDVQKNEIKTLKQRCENNHQKIESLQKRVDGFKAIANYMYGLPFVRIPRGSGKINFDKEFGKWYCEQEVSMVKKICEAIEKQQPYTLDANSMYPQAVDVCKVYQIERDQALKENDVLQERIDWISADSEKVYENLRFTDMENDRLLNEVSGYKKELSQLNLLMYDMENRLEKQVVARDGMLKQLREYKAEKKRMNKIIDALTEDK